MSTPSCNAAAHVWAPGAEPLALLPPAGFWKAFKDYDGEPINVREHQDAYEFFTRLQVRAAMRRSCILKLIQSTVTPRQALIRSVHHAALMYVHADSMRSGQSASMSISVAY